MYNKKYILEKIEEFNRPNYIYIGVEGRIFTAVNNILWGGL